MRRASGKLGLMVMMLGGLLVIGCSGGGLDPLDEIGVKYYSRDLISVFDGDVARYELDPTNGDAATAIMTLISDPDWGYDLFVDEIILTFYRTQYIDGNDPPLTPPPASWQISTLSTKHIPKNGGTLELTLWFFDSLDKLSYLEAVGLDPMNPDSRIDNLVAGYRVEITIYGSYVQGSGDRNITVRDRFWVTIKTVEEEESE